MAKKSKKQKCSIFKKILAALLCVVVLCAAVNLIVFASNIKLAESCERVNYDNQLVPVKSENGNWVFTTDRAFRVMQLTDVHFGGGFLSAGKDKKAINAVAAMITAEKPDLVIITGDIAYPVPVQAGTFNNKTGASQLITLLEKLGVYWTVTFGNHDSEVYSYYNREETSGFYTDERLDYCLYQAGPEDVDGYGNHVIEVRNSSGLITQAFVMMDSHAYAGDGVLDSVSGDYDNIHANQVDWYKSEIKKLNEVNKAALLSLEANEGSELYKNFSVVKTQCFFHIPLVEANEAWFELEANGFKDTESAKYIDGIIGETGRRVFCGAGEDDLFEAMVELGSTKAMHNGHDHFNNAEFSKDGIIFSYGNSIDYLAYIGIKNKGSQRGCTIITCKPDTSFEIDKYNYYSEKYSQTILPKESVEMQFEGVMYQVPAED